MVRTYISPKFKDVYDHINVSIKLLPCSKSSYIETNKDEIQYLDIYKEYVSYLTNSRISNMVNSGINDAYLYPDRESYHYTAKPGKVFKRLFPELLDSQIEELVFLFNKYNTYKKLKYEVQILPPNKIAWAYLQDNYYSSSGMLGNSCMRYDKCQESLKFYTQNNVEIAVIICEKKVAGRALLWPEIMFSKWKNPKRFLDRVYCNSDTHIPLFESFAEANKWVYRNRKGTGMFAYNGQGFSDAVNIPVVLNKLYHLPYTDTFKELVFTDEGIFLWHGFDGNTKAIKVIRLSNAGGERLELNPAFVEDYIEKQYIKKSDAIELDNGWTAKKNVVTLYGKPYHKKDERLCIRWDNQLDLIEYCVYNEEINLYIARNNYLICSGIKEDEETHELILYDKYVIPDYKPWIKDNCISIDNDSILIYKNDKESTKYIDTYRNKWYLKSELPTKSTNTEKYQLEFNFV